MKKLNKEMFELSVPPDINEYKMSSSVISVFYMKATAYSSENSDLGNISCWKIYIYDHYALSS